MIVRERWLLERANLEIEPESATLRLKCRVAGKIVDMHMLLNEQQMHILRGALGPPTERREEGTL